MMPWQQAMTAEMATLQALVQPLLPGITMECVAQIDSTNSELMRRFKARSAALNDSSAASAAKPVLLLAGEQSAGRGRMGRVWVNANSLSPKGIVNSPGSVLFSLGLEIHPSQSLGWSGLSLAVGICIAEALQALMQQATGANSSSANRIGLKWPNDVWLHSMRDGSERKLAGILVETASAQAERYAVIGVGINLQAPAGLPLGHAAGLDRAEGATGAAEQQQPLPALTPSAPFRATPFAAFSSLAAAGLRDVCPGVQPADVLRQALPRLAQALRLFELEGFAPFQQRFAACDLLAGRAVVLSCGDSGLAGGVDASGALQVCTSNGLQSISSSEVSVRPLAAAPQTGSTFPQNAVSVPKPC